MNLYTGGQIARFVLRCRGFNFMRYIKDDFFIVPNRRTIAGLDCESQVVYLWICARANKNGLCFPSIANLAKTCSLSNPTVIDRIKKLVRLGFIRKTTEKGKSSTYQLMLLTSKGDLLPQLTGLTTPVKGVNTNNTHRTININNKVNVDKYRPEWMPRKKAPYTER